MTTMIRAIAAGRTSERAHERRREKVVRLQPLAPPLEYRLQGVVWVADHGWGAQPRYAVEFENVCSIEALEVALRVARERSALDRHGVRIEFAGGETL